MKQGNEKGNALLEILRGAARGKQKVIAAKLGRPYQKVQEALSERHSRPVRLEEAWAYFEEMLPYERKAAHDLLFPPDDPFGPLKAA